MLKTQHKIADSYQREQSARVSPTEAELICNYGNNTLAFFGLAPQHLHFLTSGGEGLVNYQRTNHTAIVLGDPICSSENDEQVTRQFLTFCTRQHWRVAFYQASAAHLATYRTLKMHAFKMGEEALIYPQTFTLSGSAMANVRTTCRRAERDNVIISWYDGVPPPEVMQQLEDVSHVWLESKAGVHALETEFSTGRLEDVRIAAERAESLAASGPLRNRQDTIPRFVTSVATASDGSACAFVTFTPVYGVLVDGTKGTDNISARPSWGWALDLMRRVPDAPPGVMELLLVRAIERFRACGAQVISLGMVAMADTRQEMNSGQQQFARFVADRLGLLETRGTLFNFKQKFHPTWESRYLVANTTFALPKIALAVLRLRNYSGSKAEKLITKLIRL